MGSGLNGRAGIRVASQKTNFASWKLKTRNQVEFLILFHVVNSDFRQNRFLPVLREDIGLAWCQWPAGAENLYTGVFDHGDSESEKKFGRTSGTSGLPEVCDFDV